MLLPIVSSPLQLLLAPVDNEVTDVIFCRFDQLLKIVVTHVAGIEQRNLPPASFPFSSELAGCFCQSSYLD